MTREEARKAAEVMMAYAEGKEIEYHLKGESVWFSATPATFNWSSSNYRIKPEPTFRPFKSAEECWVEMQKHQPFGWAVVRESLRQVLTIVDNYVCFAGVTLYYNEAFKEAKFADGTPFGIMEE